MQTILVAFKCACGYEEPIGVDISVGIIIKGSISVICPRCGNIFDIKDTILMSPVKFQGRAQLPVNQSGVP